MRNKKGAFTDLFLFMIIAFVLVVMCAVMLYMTTTVGSDIREKIGEMDLVGDGNKNATQVYDDTLGYTVEQFKSLYWISIFLIFGMIFSIWIGSYLVTTKPIFFIPYIFILIIAVIVSVGISNAYEIIAQDPTLASTFAGFLGASFIMAKLPMVVTVVGVIGAIIMFVRMGSASEQVVNYG